ncbi:MAG: hypothetical protein Q8934_08890 [Bacillota bacterium]|nr:hypothetical protein [Bacillota bacterium]
MAINGYEAGKPTSFTPSRQATWLERFNQLLDEHRDLSRNKLTERLLEEGMDAWNRKPSNTKEGNQANLRPHSVPSNAVTLECEGLSSEQLKLLNSPEFKGIIQSFVYKLFDRIDSVQEEVLSESVLSKQETAATTSSVLVEKHQESEILNENNEKELPVEQEEENQIIAPIIKPLPPKQTGTRKKASVTDALKFVKNTTLND